jgi:hypothetical protein
MNVWKIVSREVENPISTKWDFSVSFDHQEFGPYEYIFTRDSLYFSEKIDERGSFTFPLREKMFDTTEIFLERDDIVVAVGTRGSISGETQDFIDIINLQTAQKNRFFTDEVSLIYNTQKTLELNMKIGASFMTYSLDIDTLQEISEKGEKLSAFFKLLYNWENKSYENLVFVNHTWWENTGCFMRETIKFEWNISPLKEQAYIPKSFLRKSFSIWVDAGLIDAWESSIYGELHLSDT